MKAVRGTSDTRVKERGSGMMEMVFTIPVLLLVAGSTVDIARYMTYLQVTSFVSHEAGGQIYRDCSDLTSYEKPSPIASHRPSCPQGQSLCVDVAETRAAIALCVQLAQIRFQNVLNAALGPRGTISSSVFRVNIADPSTTATCTGSPTVAQISARGDLTPSLSSALGGTTSYSPNTQEFSRLNQTCIKVGTSGTSESNSTGGTALSSSTTTSLETSQLVYVENNGLWQKFPAGSNKTDRPLIRTSDMCSRGRLVAVEVAYSFEPAVKFLPHMMTKLDTNGINREVTIF